jgi:hypothetical protein
MGFLSRLFKTAGVSLVHLPAGSFTLDRDGRIMTSTLPQSFPADRLRAIGDQVLAAFRSAKKAQMPLSEIVIHYSALKLLARELRGGAMVFLMPQSLNQKAEPKVKRVPNPCTAGL